MKSVKRIVSTSFWEDEKIVNLFTPEDKYFYLYLLTNPRTSQLGIYKFVPKLAAFDLGYSVDTVLNLLKRFEDKYGMVKYSDSTNEIAIKNFLLHSVVKGGKPVMDCMLTEERSVKDKSLLIYIYNNLKNKDIDNTTVLEYVNHLRDIYINENDNERIVDDSYNDSSSEEVPASTKTKEISTFYENIWKLYPNKRGKGGVSDTQKKKLYKIGFDQIARCIDRFKHDMERMGRDKDKIMYGSTFFNSGYVDYLDENYGYVDSSPKVDDISEPKRGISGAILE